MTTPASLARRFEERYIVLMTRLHAGKFQTFHHSVFPSRWRKQRDGCGAFVSGEWCAVPSLATMPLPRLHDIGDQTIPVHHLAYD
jgi:hypothetical protein